MALTADQATRTAPLLLAAAVLAGAFAVGVHMVPTRAASPREIIAEPVASAAGAAEFQKGWPDSDWVALSAKLDRLNHLKSLNETGEPDASTAAIQPDTPPLETGSDGPAVIQLGDFKYVGAIRIGDEAAALVQAGGVQRFVRAGSVVGRYEIVRVEPDHVVLKIDGIERKLELADPADRNLRADQRYLRDNENLRRAEQDERRRELERRRNALEPDATPNP